MAFQDKVETTERLATALAESKSTVIVDYRGLNVADITGLRRRLREQSVEFHVAKNTLLRRAATSANIEGADGLFLGPTAIATSTTDEVAPARLLSEAVRQPRAVISIRGGIVASKVMTADQIRAIAELPGREVLLARALGAAQAPAATALGVVQAAARQVLNAVTALQAQRDTAAA